jgi:iron complex transport system permease protein
MKTSWTLIGLSLALPLMIVLGVMEGGTRIGHGPTLSALAGDWSASLGLAPADAAIQTIVRDLRLPRALLSVLVGASLAAAGALLQTATRNDLADPFLFGLSSGAATGVVAAMTVSGDGLGVWTLPVAAFCGSLVAAGCVMLLARAQEGEAPERIVLAGLAVSFLFGALTHVMVFAGDQRAAHSILFWSLGGLGLARWDTLPVALAGAVILAAFVIARHRSLDALLAGDEVARSLGVDPARLRLQVFVVAAVATACCVALSGVIGFVGLMVPHLARRSAGLLHAAVLPAAALLGAILLLGSDVASRAVLPPQELPVGIVTTAIGAGFVIVMLLRRRPGAS